MDRLCLLIGLEVAVGCVGVPASGTWVELPRLLYPRYFHRAATGLEGQLIVFGGRKEAKPGTGSQTYDSEIYDPEAKQWTPGPNGMDRIVHRSTTAWISKLPDGTRRYQYRERSSKASPRTELPPGSGTPDGSAYWWGEVAPLIFDFETRRWSQGAPPRGAAVYFDELSQQWLEETGTTPRQRGLPPQRWVTPVPHWYRIGSATAPAEDKIYISGGIGYPVERMDRRKGPDGKYTLLDSLESYDLAAETWQVLAPMHHARQLHAAAVAPDGKLYVFGGYGHRGRVQMREGETPAQYEARAREMEALGREALNSVEAYDPETNTWSPRAPMPAGRHAMGAALGADGKIYVIGGALWYSNPRATDTVFVYDPKTDRWQKGPSLVRARFHHAVAAGQDGKIYAIGGRVNRLTDTAGTATVEMLDTANLPKPEGWKVRRCGALLAVLGLGCSPPADTVVRPGDPAVARVGARSIDAAELVATGRLRGETDREALLHVAIGNVLAADEARRQGLAKDPGRRAAIALIRARARIEEDTLLAQALFEAERATVSPTDAAIRAHYEETKHRYLVRKMALRRVSFDSREEAEAADLALGPDGRLDPAAAEEITATEIQRLPASVLPEATYLRRPGQRVVAGRPEEGFSLVELVDGVAAEAQPFEQVRERVREDLETLTALERVSARVEALRATARIETEAAALGDDARFEALEDQGEPVTRLRGR